jgi:hypothetical protein
MALIYPSVEHLGYDKSFEDGESDGFLAIWWF